MTIFESYIDQPEIRKKEQGKEQRKVLHVFCIKTAGIFLHSLTIVAERQLLRLSSVHPKFLFLFIPKRKIIAKIWLLKF